MKNKKIGSILLLAIWMMFGCSEKTDSLGSGVENIIMTVKDFEYDPETRTSIAVTGNDGVKFVWAAHDTVGIFPNRGHQVDFPMVDGAGTNTALFNGGGWALKPWSTYAAYYPYNFQNRTPTYVVVNFEGQTQQGQTTTHLGAYDYMASVATTPENGMVNFEFNHLCALVELNFSVPEKGSVTSVSLECDEKVFATSGHVDLTSSAPAIIPDKTTMSNKMLVDIKGLKTSADNELVKVYFMLPPTHLKGKKVGVVVTTNGIRDRIEVPFKDLLAGNAYQIQLNLPKPLPIRNVYHVAKAGTLPQLIGERNKYTISELKLTGELNGTDILFIREMCGSGLEETPFGTTGNLKTLDMHDARIVSGGSAYYKFWSEVQTTIDDRLCNRMFSRCYSLQKVILPQSVNAIGECAFEYCFDLRGMDVPEKVTKIEDHAFWDCKKLAYIHIPNSVKSIGFRVFMDNDALTEITVPNSVTSIDWGTFLWCDHLTTVTLSKNLTIISNELFSGCTSITNIVIPDKVTSINDCAFENCSGLTSIAIPMNVTHIGEKVFKECSKLLTITVNKGMISLPDHFLSTADHCTTLYLPSTLKKIMNSALPGSVQHVYCFATQPPVIDGNSGVANCNVYVPVASVGLYKTDKNWSKYTILPMPDNVTEK